MSPARDDAETHDWHAGGSGTARSQETEPPVSQIGRYQVERRLGAGGFGAVYLAHDEQLKRRVAVKVPHRRLVPSTDDVELYLAEAQVLAKLDHPHIVPVYDVGQTDDGLCYIVSKFIEGSNLSGYVKRAKPSVGVAVEIVACIAEALQHAHQRGVIHRDVKPGNILMDAAGHPFLADFDLALKEEDYGKGSGYGGTPAYMSPEQARGEGHLLDGRSDVFSLGVVLYELLTGARPFGRGTMREMAERITTWEVRTPRQVDPSVPRELERICLRAVAKLASDRFLTAGEMAEELRQYQAAVNGGGGIGRAPIRAASNPQAMTGNSDDSRRYVRVIPKGLRAFDRQDSEFFLNLLPGPRDREGMPESLRFWKSRIESENPEDVFRVGVVYGPSGCGKSSLLRAGLLPVLDDRRIACAYVEAAAGDTEARLLRRLRHDFSELPDDLELRDTIACLRRRQVDTGGRKVLLVLDQFEQCLAMPKEAGNRELIEALRQCDGHNVQCLLTVRDDFWLALSRFLAELEVHMVAGFNVALADLFDLRHAQQVLGAFGRAYEALPAEPAEWNPTQEQFLAQAVQGLSQDGKVICVRLALFAEMMKAKPWEPSVLQDLGGAEGIGVAFLEETFSSNAREPRYRHHAAAARSVLESLLPPPTSDIKGHLCTREDLLQASGYTGRLAEFDELMRILDVELRLVTPTDREDIDRSAAEPTRTEDERDYYQLTHDYLVPSLREWLARKRRETKRGRAELRLAERAELWSVKPETKQLPSFWEWLQMCRLTRRTSWTDPQRKMMQTARRYHLLRAAALCALLLLCGAIAVAAYSRIHAAHLMRRLFEAETLEVAAVVDEMQPWRWWVDPLLRQADTEQDPRHRLHLCLARLPHDASQVSELQEHLLDGSPDEVRVIRDALGEQGELDEPFFWNVLTDPDASATRRFRAACALAEYAPDDSRWNDVAAPVAEWLCNENPTIVLQWYLLLKAVHQALLPPLKEFHVQGEPGVRLTAAIVLADVFQMEPDELVLLNRSGDKSQSRVLFEAFRACGPPAIALLQQELTREDKPDARDEDRAQLVREKTAAATLLMRLGKPDGVWPLLAQNQDAQLRTALIHSMAAAGVGPDIFMERLSKERDSLRKIALLFILGEYRQPILTDAHRAQLRQVLPDIFRTDPHPGVHSASEWLLRKIGDPDRVVELAGPLRSKDPPADRDWYINQHGQTFVVIRGPVTFQMGSPDSEFARKNEEPLHEETIGHSFAIGTKELTLRDFRAFWPEWRDKQDGDDELDQPVAVVRFQTMMAYCNFLSGKEDIPADQFCFEDLGNNELRPYPDCLSRTGYRLPTEAEWEYACRGGTTSPRADGFGLDYLAKYAWYKANAGSRLHDVGQLKANDFGLFDMYGNAAECCLDDHKPQYKNLRGGSYNSEPYSLRSAARGSKYWDGAMSGHSYRLARTIPKATRENPN